MKAVTEFPNFTINKALQTKATLTAEGKTPEDIQTSLGETFKYEGDKLKHFVNALEVAGTNTENLKRVLVMSLNEGETAPNKAVKIEEFHYVPEFLITRAAAAPAKADAKGGRGGGKGGPGRGGPGKGAGGPKESPWGMSPEQIAAKKKGGGPKPS
ncbi:MAG: hypothetical protein V4736_05510 [Bdellovibrionota bacterium]